MAKTLRFPDGKILKRIPEPKPIVYYVTKYIDAPRVLPSLNELILFFDEPSHQFETLKGAYETIAKKFRQRQEKEKEKEQTWGS